MNNKLLNNLESDLQILNESNFHPKNNDLLQIFMREDIPELIKFARKVNKVLDLAELPRAGDYSKGYYDGIMQIKGEIYSKE